MPSPDEHLVLLRIFSLIVDSNAGTPILGQDRRLADAEGLAVKCFFHSASAFYLQRGTNLPEIKAHFNDPASINVLTRAALESALTFSYVFASPANDAERDFRYHSWAVDTHGNRNPGTCEHLRMPVYPHSHALHDDAAC